MAQQYHNCSFNYSLKERAFVSCMQTKTLLFKRVIIRCSRMYEQDSSYRKCIVQCSLEYTIRGDVVVVATVVDDVILKGCRIVVIAVVAYVVEVL